MLYAFRAVLTSVPPHVYCSYIAHQALFNMYCTYDVYRWLEVLAGEAELQQTGQVCLMNR
jgi:hypothetical protein